MTVLLGVWTVVLALLSRVICQDGFSNQELLRLHQLSASAAAFAAGDEPTETVTGYNTNIVHRDPATNQHSVSAVSVQFRTKDDPAAAEKSLSDYHRSNAARSDPRRKIFHIRNPFQRQLDDERQHDEYELDNDTGSSSQYASMQYTLPPEEFLKQMRAEGHLPPQYSTPAPALSYVTTPQPLYQYQSPAPASGYDNRSQPNQISQQYASNAFQAQASDPNAANYNFYGSSYASEASSTPSPQVQYISTPSPAVQFVGTPSSSYVSSASPNFLSSPPSQLQYLSSPSSQINTGLGDYGSRINSPSGSAAFEGGNQNSNLQIDHYNNANNGIRYPFNGQPQQYQNEVASTTISPSSSSMFPDRGQDAWRNVLNSGVDTLSKSVQELNQLSQYQSNSVSNSQQESGSVNDQNSFNGNGGDTHRIGNTLQSPNNLYMNFMQPDYQLYHNVKTRTRDVEQETGQPEVYSHGDYGWKMNGKRPLVGSETFGAGSYSHLRPQALPLESTQSGDNSYSKYSSSSQTNFQGDSQKPQNINLGYSIGFNSQRVPFEEDFGGKTSSAENLDTQEFVKAAAKVHENMKLQQSQRSNEQYYGQDTSSPVATYAQNYPSNSYYGNSQSPTVVSTYYGNTDKQQRENKYYSDTSTQTPYSYSYNQNDLVTAATPSYLYGNLRNGYVDSRTKQPFDHAKALKNIVPIDVTNVIYNQENGIKSLQNYVNSQRLAGGSQKDQMDQNIKHLLDHYNNNKPLTDAYYKDKNAGYGFNIKSKPDNYVASSEGTKPSEVLHYTSGKHGVGEMSYGQDYTYDTKRYADGRNAQANYQQQSSNPSYQQLIQPSASMQQNSYRPQDINMLKLNDIPYKLSQNSISLGLGAVSSYDPNLPPQIPSRINQSVGSHHLEHTNSLLNKLNLFGPNKLYGGNFNRPGELDQQNGAGLSTINGIRVANPFNVDLKLVSDMLKGKPAVDETRMIPLRDHYNRILPMKLDMSSLQHLLSKNENAQSSQEFGGDPRNKDYGNYDSLAALTGKFREAESDGLSSLASQYVEALNSGRYPYQNAVKYSRSQEEEETIIPAADGSNTHPIGAVVEQEGAINLQESSEETDLISQDIEDSSQNSFNEHRPKLSPPFDLRDHRLSGPPRHPNGLFPGRHHYHRKYPKDDHLSEPYPLLKPPRPPRSRFGNFKSEKRSRRRRLPKLISNRMLKTQPLFEAEQPAEGTEENTPVPTAVQRPPPPKAQSKSDDTNENKSE